MDWVNFITTEPFSPSLEIVGFYRETILFYDGTIQVNELF